MERDSVTTGRPKRGESARMKVKRRSFKAEQERILEFLNSLYGHEMTITINEDAYKQDYVIKKGDKMLVYILCQRSTTYLTNN